MPGLDPGQGMLDSRKMITDLGDILTQYAQEPIDLSSSYVQPLPTFTGGGLPMPIGVTGRDPALSNPSLLTNRRQNTVVHRDVPPPEGGSFPQDGFWPDPNNPPDTSGGNPIPIPNPDETVQYGGLPGMQSLSGTTPGGRSSRGSSGTVARRRLGQGSGRLTTDPGDDSQKASAAVQLLLQSIGGGA
jgi:hypothetical protein